MQKNFITLRLAQSDPVSVHFSFFHVASDIYDRSPPCSFLAYGGSLYNVLRVGSGGSVACSMLREVAPCARVPLLAYLVFRRASLRFFLLWCSLRSRIVLQQASRAI